MRNHKPTILLVGGGTGGHAAPILAVSEELRRQRPEVNIVAIGAGTPEEREFLAKIPDYRVVTSGKLNRYFTFKNVIEFVKLMAGFAQSFVLLLRIKPKVIFSKGGFASFPLIMAAKLIGIPYLIHESDIVMGKVNLKMSKGAEKIFVCYEKEYYRSIPRRKLVFSGPVLREGFEKQGAGDRKLFGFQNDLPVILLTGGSQGSLNLTEKFLPIAGNLLQRYNIIHQAGKHSIAIAEQFQRKLAPKLKARYYLAAFLGKGPQKDYMLEAINSSSLIISRAGSTIAELAVLGKAMLLVPWQHSAQNHQAKNAEFFERNKAATVIEEKDLTPEILENKINELFASDQEEIKRLSRAALKVLPNDAASIITREILNLL